ncbi:ATP-binding protein [Novosphingobium sp.]|uniref:sensor histidine kinase n=1 Tax=Novosphingobium sp. TaxID=1874826 RepID=UPI003B52988F
MTLIPRSLFGRLLGIAALTTLVALVFAGFAIGHVLERFVTQGLDQQLDAQVDVLARAIRRDGSLDRARAISLPAFDEPGSGWGWRVDGPAGAWTHGAAIDAPRMSDMPDPPLGPDRPGPAAGHPHPAAGHPHPGDNHDVHFRRIAVDTSAGPVVLTAAGPRAVAIAPLHEALVPLLVSLCVLGAGLAGATLLQLRLGLAPLRRLRLELAEVRSGRLHYISSGLPAEIAPLATELNALIDQNEQGLAHARRHVSNLAHGLKTPLAALGLKLAEPGRDPDGSLGAMVDQIDRRVRHHLGRARARAQGGSARSRTPLAPAIADIAGALARIHAERPVGIAIDVAADFIVAIDPQDLDEIVGNLLDNAWQHASATITVGARMVEASIELTIADDGPGLDHGAIRDALAPGRRIDERGDGHGFGLPIAQELLEINGGSLALEPASGGGLRAVILMPVAP